MSRARRSRHSKIAGAATHIPDGVDPATVTLNRPRLPSTAAWREQNRAHAKASNERALARLVCQERGCRESLATLQLDPDASGPGIRLAIHALWQFEEHDDRVVQRVRLLGATDPTSDPVYVRLTAMRQGQRVEFVCRHRHESRFGAGHLAQRLRAVLP